MLFGWIYALRTYFLLCTVYLRNTGSSLQPSRFLFECPENNQKTGQHNETTNKIRI